MSNPFTLQRMIFQIKSDWDNAPDPRKPNNNMRYTISDAIMSAFSVFFLQSSSFLAHQRILQDNKGRNNATSLFDVERIPSDQQIRNLLDPLDVHFFHANFWNIFAQFKDLTMRLLNSRLMRQTLAFSKDVQMYRFSAAWEDLVYNFARPVKTLRTKTTDHLWHIKELLTTLPLPNS